MLVLKSESKMKAYKKLAVSHGTIRVPKELLLAPQ